MKDSPPGSDRGRRAGRVPAPVGEYHVPPSMTKVTGTMETLLCSSIVPTRATLAEAASWRMRDSFM
jgi:hypothetical protein